MLGKRKNAMPYPYAKKTRTVTLERRSNNRRGGMGVSSISLFQAGRAGPELKNFDYFTNSYNPAADIANFTPIFTPQTGTGATRMVGRKATIKSFQARYSVLIGATVSASLNTGFASGRGVRIMFVYDKMPAGVAPLVTDVLVTNNTTSALNLENSDRFIVLHDKVMDMGAVNVFTGAVTYTQSNGLSYQSGSMYKKLSLPFSGPSDAGGSGGLDVGSILFYALTDYSDATDNTIVSCYARTRFIDN